MACELGLIAKSELKQRLRWVRLIPIDYLTSAVCRIDCPGDLTYAEQTD